MYATRMPFGKWQGYAVEDVATDYLQWALVNAHDGLKRHPWLRQVLVEELLCRGVNAYEGRHQAPLPPRPCPKCQEAKAVFNQFYRKLSLLVHPDRAGDSRTMAVLNEFHQKVMAALGR